MMMIKAQYLFFLILLAAASKVTSALVDSLSLRRQHQSVRSVVPRIKVVATVEQETSVTEAKSVGLPPPFAINEDAAMTQYHQTHSEGLFTPSPTPTSSTKNLSLSTWKRRLNTREDPFDIHKWAGLGWWISATAIFGTGTLSGFTNAPPVLEYYTYLFLIATLVQAASSVPMVMKFRSNEPTVQRGFISSAIASSSSAIVGVWLSPYVTNENTILSPGVVATLVGFFVVADTLYSITAFEDVQAMLKNFQVREVERGQKAREEWAQKYSALLPTIPWALPLNLILLHEMIYHAHDMRNYFAVTIVEHGSSLDLVYYASLVTSIAVSVGNLAATLHHRKLISKQVEDVALIGSWVVTFVFNLKAAGLY